MSAALVTVVTPSLNQSEYIQAAIDSVLMQDYPAVEYVVADGGSSDGTVQILERAGSRVRWTSCPDDGQASALNHAFANARGEFLAWLNSDDLYLPGALSNMVRALQVDPDIGLVYGHADLIDSAGARLGPAHQVELFDRDRLLNEIDFVVQPATMFRRSAFEAVGGLDATLHWAFDYDLWLRLAGSSRVLHIDRMLALARIHGSAKTATGGLNRLLEIERMARKHGRTRIPDGFAARMAWEQGAASVSALRRWQLSDAARHCLGTMRYGWAYVTYRVRRLPKGHFETAPRRHPDSRAD